MGEHDDYDDDDDDDDKGGNAPAPRGAIHPAKRGSVRALAPRKAEAVPTEPKSGMGRVLMNRGSEAMILVW